MCGRDKITARLQTLFRDVFDDESIEIRDEMTAEDVDEWDSVSHISLVLAIEQEFGLRLSAAEIGGLANVGAMISLLIERATR